MPSTRQRRSLAPRAVSGGSAAITWFDERDGNREVYLAVVSDNPTHEALEAHALRVTSTPGESIGAYVAWNDERIGLVWSDELEGQHEVFFQSFDSTGRATEASHRLTRNTTASLIPSIQTWADGFALVWNEDVVEERGTHESGGRSEVMFSLVP